MNKQQTQIDINKLDKACEVLSRTYLHKLGFGRQFLRELREDLAKVAEKIEEQRENLEKDEDDG